MTAQWLPVLLVAIPLFGVGVLTLLPDSTSARGVAAVAAVISAAVFGVAVLAWAVFDRSNAEHVQMETDVRWVPALDLYFHLGVDGVSLPLVLLTSLLVLLCCIYTIRVRPHGGRLRGFLALVLLLETGMLGTFVALDLLLFFLFFEVVLIPMWFVIAWWGDHEDPRGRVAAATTFILYTLIGSAVMLLGILLVYVRTGTFDLVELAARGGAEMGLTTQVLAAVAILAGLAVKAPMWPLHTWLPDAHTKAPTVGSVLLAGVLLKMGTYGMVRVAVPVVPDGMREVAPWLAGFGVVGIIYGSLACLAQRDLKRLIAYSSVGHMGFVLLGIASMSPQGINGALYANIAHGLITGLLFFLVGGIKDRHGTSDLDRLGGGLYIRAPRLGFLLAFAAIASLGLPGLAGFWGEMLALLGAFRPEPALSRPYFVVLMAIAGVGAVLTTLYLVQMVRRVCQAGPAPAARPVLLGDVTAVEAAAWVPLVALTVLLGVWPGLLLELTNPAVGLIFAGGSNV
jgi:NADH-quinone oxidoreductase subunit M